MDSKVGRALNDANNKVSLTALLEAIIVHECTFKQLGAFRG